ncbi:flagellar hook-length control protein FliK [Pantoea dispersa]|uniref:Flagellar hook-length control protein-like C-terminal domain-containing protein n=1 Tax=Pantoea dispersa TaxID=59814 RepID=A0ABY3A272_9GAMM|nr:flagellar hook-length control protein FliK [Pantoea dispersa]TQC76856.1 hypothetical protein FK492_02290 [Pantoea dispersa]
MPVMPLLTLLTPGNLAGRGATGKVPDAAFSALLTQRLGSPETTVLPQALPEVASSLTPVRIAEEGAEAEDAPLPVPAQMDASVLQQLVAQLPVASAVTEHPTPATTEAPVPAPQSMRLPVATRATPDMNPDSAAAHPLVADNTPAPPTTPGAPDPMTVTDTRDAVPLREVISADSAPALTALPGAARATSDSVPAAEPVLRVQLQAAPGSEPWQQAIGQQLKVMVQQGVHRAELKLHPEDLGTVQVSLRLQQDQAQLLVLSDHPQVRAALEATLPQLRHALAESGIQLGESSVSTGNFEQQPQPNTTASPDAARLPEGDADSAGVTSATLSVNRAATGAISTFV